MGRATAAARRRSRVAVPGAQPSPGTATGRWGRARAGASSGSPREAGAVGDGQHGCPGADDHVALVVFREPGRLIDDRQPLVAGPGGDRLVSGPRRVPAFRVRPVARDVDRRRAAGVAGLEFFERPDPAKASPIAVRPPHSSKVIGKAAAIRSAGAAAPRSSATRCQPTTVASDQRRRSPPAPARDRAAAHRWPRSPRVRGTPGTGRCAPAPAPDG